MKKIILTAVLLLSALQAENIVHYDTKETTKSQMDKPNYPNDRIYTKK
ncbi:hypothetical protein SAMN06313486_10618 [Epsilonproteobacteria bacterium SCGC AD-308-P11]|jgi:hypothetical protein|nr:hypothetical protein SAMN06313486_10618 [Epsilonproteobacteria bacterium SCGC AD-308-P11]